MFAFSGADNGIKAEDGPAAAPPADGEVKAEDGVKAEVKQEVRMTTRRQGMLCLSWSWYPCWWP
jgi:hypothetical protein